MREYLGGSSSLFICVRSLYLCMCVEPSGGRRHFYNTKPIKGLAVILCNPPSPLGSHNAITYCLDMNDRSPVDLTQPDLLQKLDKYMKPLIRPFVYKWAVTQVTNALPHRSPLSPPDQVP